VAFDLCVPRTDRRWRDKNGTVCYNGATVIRVVTGAYPLCFKYFIGPPYNLRKNSRKCPVVALDCISVILAQACFVVIKHHCTVLVMWVCKTCVAVRVVTGLQTRRPVNWGSISASGPAVGLTLLFFFLWRIVCSWGYKCRFMKPTTSIDLVPSVKLNVAVSPPPLLLSCHPKIKTFLVRMTIPPKENDWLILRTLIFSSTEVHWNKTGIVQREYMTDKEDSFLILVRRISQESHCSQSTSSKCLSSRPWCFILGSRAVCPLCRRLRAPQLVRSGCNGE
jgi:hypothetical protein